MKTIAPLQSRSAGRRCGRSMLASSALSLAALVLPLAAAPAATLRETLARGLVAEEVNRDLESARRDYEAVLAEFTDQRAVAASALFRLAEIHRAQGRKDEAITHYQRLLREFPDAGREKDLARRQLAEWQIAPVADGPTMAAIDGEEAALQRLKLLRQNSPDVFRKAENEMKDAIKNGWSRVLGYLLEEGLDSGFALVHASNSGNLEAVKLILALPEKPGGQAAHDAILESIYEEHEEVFRTLLAAGLDLNFQSVATKGNLITRHGTVLHKLMSPGLLPKIRQLIDAGADVNASSQLTGHTPLHIALTRSQEDSANFTELIKLLLDKGADANARTTHESPHWSSTQENPKASLSTLNLAMRANRPELITLLLERGADAKQEGLLAAACSLPDSLEIARKLLDRGADPNLPAENPPIIRAFQNIIPAGTPNEQIASHRHQVALIRLLLERGADPNTVHGTFQRESVHPSFRHEVDYGISLFAKPVEKSVEFPAGLFHQVMWLLAQHKILNLELIQILLDAGAVPKEEFPEVFTFVASNGRSMRAGGGSIILNDGDADPVEIARTLLAHRPAEVFPENLIWAKHWDLGVRRLVMDELIYPPLVKSGGITLSDFEGGIMKPLVAPGETVPDTATLLFNNRSSLRFTTLTRIRRGPDGAGQRTIIAWLGADKLPDLQPGDLIEMEGEEPDDSLLHWSLQKRLPSFPVTFEIDGGKREITLRPDLLAFDPASNEAPLLDATALTRLLGQGLSADGNPYVMERGSLTLRRKEWLDLKLALSSSTKPFPLEAGDHLVVERDPDSLILEHPPITLTVPGLPFIRWFNAGGAPTLVQAIADAWSPWQEIHGNIRLPQDDETSLAWRASRQSGQAGESYVSTVPRDPDFSKIRIRRKPQDGEESVISIDLEKAIRACTDETSPAEARLADVQLQSGDLIEIPLREPSAIDPWTGFSPETVRFLDKVLSARFVVIDSSQGVQPREFRYQSPRWIDGPHGLIALPPVDGSPTARFIAIAKGHDQQINQLLRGGKESPLPISSTKDWFVRDGDQVTLQGSHPQPSQGSPRVRSVVPPPPVPNGR